MKLFILAAGKGTRLWPLTEHTPKSLIDLGDGTSLLERQLRTAVNSKLFNEITIITGYQAEKIDAKIASLNADIPITTIFNPFYEMSNNLISLWLANYKMHDDDFMITNGDNLYKEYVFSEVVSKDEESIQVTIDIKDSYDEDDMKVKIRKDGYVSKIHKKISLAETNAESVGLALVKGTESRRVFVSKLCELVRRPEYINKFWLEIFNSMIGDGVLVKTKEIRKEDWQEMDFPPDRDYIEKLVVNGF